MNGLSNIIDAFQTDSQSLPISDVRDACRWIEAEFHALPAPLRTDSAAQELVAAAREMILEGAFHRPSYN